MNNQLYPHDFDVAIIGGGINGTGVARDAAGRGLRTLLLESRDLAAATSSASTKLIHGGLRYLEYYEFALVRKSLHERAVLLNLAPHIIWPLTFVLPHQPYLRPRWLLRMGLYLYDLLAGWQNPLPRSRAINFKNHAFGTPLQSNLNHGFTYSDCWVQDSRLVVLNAVDARASGATILTHTPCTKITPIADGWRIETPGKSYTARAVVNAGGPWVDTVLGLSPLKSSSTVKLVKGSHIITKKLFAGEQAYILQTKDRRIVFAIPYEEKFTLIGTTDTPYTGDPYAVKIDDLEVAYLLQQANNCFAQQLTSADIISSYSGVRPLLDDGAINAASVTRDYNLVWHNTPAPAVSVYGGKITTYRKLAVELVDRLAPLLGNDQPAWTHTKPLPGGDLTDVAHFQKTLAVQYGFLPSSLIARYTRAYGTNVYEFLGGVTQINDMGEHFGDDVYQVELDYLRAIEFATCADDILWRRSKLGLHVTPQTVTAITRYMGA